MPKDVDSLLVVISDIEMGAGGMSDDFPDSHFLGRLIQSYNRPPHDNLPVHLVFNGDTFDLLKTPYRGVYPRHITGDVALGKMSSVATAHPGFFDGVRCFLEHSGSERRVSVVVGNHDAELVFPSVQQMIRRLCGWNDGMGFSGFNLQVGKVFIEHGHQYDAAFATDVEKPFLIHHGERILNISWGASAVLDTVMYLQRVFPFHDRLNPRALMFHLLPDLQTLVMDIMWKYWSRDYWKSYFLSDDPTKRLTRTMIKDLICRLWHRDSDVRMECLARDRVRACDDIMLRVLGHQHRQEVWICGDRKLMVSGAFRNEYMILDDGCALRPIPKTYIECYMKDGVPVSSRFVEIEGPPDPEGYVPDSIFDIVPCVREMLGKRPSCTQRS